jgi:outer membrane immunogenic protein
MKHFKLAASLLISASLFSSVTNADVLMKEMALPANTDAHYNWTGFYVGINAGLVKSTMNVTDNGGTSFNATIQQVSNPNFTGGFQLGYRRQLDMTRTTSGLLGVEFSGDFSDGQFNQQYGSEFALYNLSSTYELKDLCLLELIGGITADKTLLFIAGGLSWANITGNMTSLDGAPFFNTFNDGKNVVGTAIGGGIEYAVTNNFSVRFKADVITPNIYSTNDNTDNTFQISNNIVQATFGLNYKFG